MARDALALLVIIFLFGLVFLAPYYYFAKKVLPSPRTLFGANVVDIVFGLLLTLAAIIWIYFPQRQGVSFADGTGLIIDKGVITEYGHQVKLRHVLTMVLISSFYILFCGLWQRLR